MTPPPTNPQIQSRAEGLLASLAGVISARVRLSITGDVQEIHVLATPELHPKQVVRNVESALRAGLGLEFDRRVVSVAQLSGGTTPPVQQPHHASPAPEVDVADAAGSPAQPAPEPAAAQPAVRYSRIVFLGYDARLEGAGQTVCTVRLGRDDAEYTGTGEGGTSAAGRAEAAARALFAALTAARGDEALALEGAALVESHGRTYVIVSATALDGRETVPLAGAARLTRSPEESAILAGLQATNRWSDIPSQMEWAP
jgi:hypothetical protein